MQCTYTHTHSLTMLVYMRVVVYLRQSIYLHPYPHTHSVGQYKWCNLVGEAWKSTFTQVAPLAPLTCRGREGRLCDLKKSNGMDRGGRPEPCTENRNLEGRKGLPWHSLPTNTTNALTVSPLITPT